MPDQSASISHTADPSDPDVQAVGDQAEPGVEAEESLESQSQLRRQPVSSQGDHAPPDRPAPRNKLRVGVGGQLCAGEFKQAKVNRLHVPAAEPCVKNVAELMYAHHGQPTHVEERDNEDKANEIREESSQRSCPLRTG